MKTRDQFMLRTAQSELGRDAENLLEKLATFEVRYPQIWSDISENLHSQADMNLGDLINMLQIFSELAK